MKGYKALVLLLFMSCCFRVAAYEVQLTSSELSIEDDLRRRRNFFDSEKAIEGSIVTSHLTIDDDIRKRRWNYWHHGWWDLRYGNMAGVKLGKSSNGEGSTGDFRITISNRPVSLAHTTFKDGNLLGPEPKTHEFGESPDFDADSPIGDAIVPMMVLLGLLVGYKMLYNRLQRDNQRKNVAERG